MGCGFGCATYSDSNSDPLALCPFFSTGSRQDSVSNPPQFSQIGAQTV
jgi:hypothetical protein